MMYTIKVEIQCRGLDCKQGLLYLPILAYSLCNSCLSVLFIDASSSLQFRIQTFHLMSLFFILEMFYLHSLGLGFELWNDGIELFGW